jgi:protein phosphatase
MADPHENWRENLVVAAHTSVGMRRSNNQDSHAVVLAGDRASWSERGHIFMVADGMGAHAAGELASKLAVDNIPHTYRKMPQSEPPAALEKAIVAANQLIHGRGQADADFRGMGTTCSTLVLLPEGALLGHVGDSRAYRLRGEALEQLTFDHSLVWEMIASGQIDGEEAAGFVPKNVITRSLGPNAQVKVDLEGPLPIEVGDTYLLCSDGLTGPVRDEEIAVVLAALPLEEAVQTLIDLANLRGGPDNITVVAAHVKGPLDGAEQGRGASGRSSQAGAVHPAVWISAFLLVLLALVLLVMGLPVATGFILIGAAVAALVGLTQRYGGTAAAPARVLGGPYGKGPYRSYDGRATPAAAEKFAETVRRLTDAARRDALPLDWARLSRLKAAAEQAAADADYREAIAQHCRAMRYVTGELHKVRGR